MLRSYVIELTVQSNEYEIFVSPLSLHTKEIPENISGKVTKLFFYNRLKDEDYKQVIEKDKFLRQLQIKNHGLILNYGQDFEKHYLGNADIDFENKILKNWNESSNKVSEEFVKKLSEAIFNHTDKHKSTILFTPTKPLQINLSQGKYNF